MAEHTKEFRIKKEKNKLRRMLTEVPESKKKMVEKLIDNAAFMSVTLEDMMNQINEEGSVIICKNGNGFDITQEHPAQKAYVNMMGKYSSVMNQLMALQPDSKADSVNKAGEKLAKFVIGGKPVELR